MTVTAAATTTVTVADDDIDNIDEDINEDDNTTLMTTRVRTTNDLATIVGQDGNRVVRMSTHRVKNPGIGVRMSTHHKNPGIVMHHLKKAGMVRQMPESPESPYVQRNSTGTTRVARTNPRWRREHARGKE